MIREIQELKAEDMEKVNGGYIYDTHNISLDGYIKYEVIDDKTGDVLQTVKSYAEAYSAAQRKGLSTKQITISQLKHLRETGSLD